MKKKQVSIPVFSSIEATRMQMPCFNAYKACGVGVWKSAKYKNRQGRKAETRRMIAEY